MNCSQIESLLDDYIDASLESEAAASTTLHLLGCSDCEKAFQERRQTRLELKRLEVPAPSAGFFDKAVAKAVEIDAEPSRRRSDQQVQPTARSIVGSLAAAVLVALLIGSIYLTDSPASDPGLPTISLDTGTVTPVKLAFSSEQALVNARFSIQLPVGVELVGYDGQSDLSWTTDLEPGTNVLRLPLVGRTAVSDILIAKLEHPTGTKTFRLQVTVK